MKKLIATMASIGLMSGCATTDWTKPTFPTVPPPKPDGAPLVKTRADVEKSDASKSDSSRTRGPVNANQVTDRNAPEILKALDAELDQDSNKPTPKP